VNLDIILVNFILAGVILWYYYFF